LDGMRKVPLAERMGVIDGVMVKTFRVHADQRGYFLEQLKRGDHDDQGRPSFPTRIRPDVPLVGVRARRQSPELIKAFHWHKRQWDYWT